MDFSLSPEQLSLRDTVRRYCQEKYDFKTRQASIHSAPGYNTDHWRQFAELGWLGAALPEQAGGSGGTIIETAIILEEFGKVLVVEPYLSTAILAGQILCRISNHTRRLQLLRELVEGRLLASLAHFEPSNEDSAYELSTVAQRTADDTFIIHGKKRAVLGGDQAHIFIVSARMIDQPAGREKIRLFLIDSSAPGLFRRPFQMMDGAGAADLILNDVTLQKDSLLEFDDITYRILDRAISEFLIAICAELVGSMSRVVADTTKHLKTRRAYGTFLSSFQVLQHRLADMLTELELARCMLYSAIAACSIDDPVEFASAVSAAKAFVGRAGKFVGAQGIQLHGAMGLVDDYVIGQQFKRLTVLDQLFGDSDFHLIRRFRL